MEIDISRIFLSPIEANIINNNFTGINIEMMNFHGLFST